MSISHAALSAKILFQEFHKQRLAGLDSVNALRNAQLSMLKAETELSNHPRMWALFEIIGGVAQRNSTSNYNKLTLRNISMSSTRLITHLT